MTNLCPNCGSLRHNCHCKEESAPPTTVRGWLDTLPDLENAPSYEGSKGLDKPCKTIWEAIAWIMNNSKGITTKRYFRGVYDCLRHEIPPQPNQYRAYYAGYNAAKAAYEAQEKRKTTVLDVINTLPFESPDSGLGLKSRMASITSHYWDDPAETLLEVTTKIMKGPFIDGDAKLFWEGVHEYYRGYKDGFYSSIAADGHILAQWTMEKASAPAYQIKEVWESVDPKELAELRDKAAKWDELQHTLRRLKIC